MILLNALIKRTSAMFCFWILQGIWQGCTHPCVSKIITLWNSQCTFYHGLNLLITVCSVGQPEEPLYWNSSRCTPRHHAPPCFLIYINDLPSCVHNQIKLYADDILLYSHNNSVADCISLQQDLYSLMY